MKNRKNINNVIFLICSVVACAFAMCFVDGVIKPQYFIKSLIKLLLFLIVPCVYFLINKSEKVKFFELFKIKKRNLIISLMLGIFVYFIILFGYFLLRTSFDFSIIAGKLTENAGVSASNFLCVALYISFVNSFLEEIFFRGFGFIILKNNANRYFAYVFSALLFALYHTGMMIGYYDIGILLLTVSGLLVAGIMFNFINEKSENIYSSWLVHMFANFGINTVGFILFDML